MSYETQIIEMFLKNGANPNIIIDDESPLHKSVYSGNVKLVEILLDNGADPNIIKNIEDETWDTTPLNLACERLNIPIIKLLLEHGAIPNDNDDETNLFWIFENYEASSEQKIDAIKLLLEHGYKFYRYDYSQLIGLKDDDIEIAKFLLQYIQDPDIKNKALLNVAKKDQPEMVILLLDNGADPNTIDKYNKDTPLIHAIDNENLPMMILLLDRGADPYYIYEDDYDKSRKYNMLELARSVRFYSGLEYLETYISEKNKMQNREQRLAMSMALNPRLGQESVLDIDESGIFDKIASYVPEYNSRYAPDVSRRMMLEDKQRGRGKRRSKKLSSRKRSHRKSYKFY
jgi:ankyrin repeat protein